MGQTLIDIGVFCGALTVIIGFGTLIVRLPPVRWAWGQLVSGPLGRWTTGLIADGVQQFHEDTVMPQILAIEGKVDVLLTQSETSWHRDKAWMVARVTRIEERQRQLVAGVVAVLERPEDGISTVAAVLAALNDLEGDTAPPIDVVPAQPRD